MLQDVLALFFYYLGVFIYLFFYFTKTLVNKIWKEVPGIFKCITCWVSGTKILYIIFWFVSLGKLQEKFDS